MGASNYQPTNKVNWDIWSAQAMMLGNLEQQTVYNAINFMVGTTNVINGTSAVTKFNVFMCPSDPNVGQGSSSLWGTNDNSYVGSIGTTTTEPNYGQPLGTWATQGCTGLFWYYRSYGIASITDGTSNTIAFSEGIVGGPAATTGYRGTAVMSASIASAQMYDAWQNPTAITTGLNTCTSKFLAGTGLNRFRGLYWEEGSMGMTWFNTIVTPNSQQYKWGACRSDGGGWPDWSSFANVSSNHSGGVNCLTADGSVKFIKDSINRNTWWSLGTRANGEVIDASSY
jgi:prepilin-type processing-associated H-X9-DG protein